MIDYEQIREIHKKSNRIKLNAGVTPDNVSFTYASNGRYVKKGTPYHIHYTADFKEYYMTGRRHNIFSRIINPTDPDDISDFKRYSDNPSKQYENLYQVPTRGKPTPEDYRNGSFIRYFAKRINDPEVPVFEVNKRFKSPLYQIYTLVWRLSGGTASIIRKHNEVATIKLIRRIPGLKKLITNFSEFYIMPTLTEELQIQRDLGLLGVRRDKNGNKVFNK